jgi:sugar phosphate isomerase/epimerase
VRILLDNIPNELSTPERLVEMIRMAHFEDVGVCFDVGHAHMAGDLPAAFETLKSLIHSTHIHDNNGQDDQHLWPGAGSLDWRQAMELLRSAPQKPPLLLEVAEDEKVNPIEKMGEAFRKLEAA